MAHFHAAKGARTILTMLLTGILDKEAMDLLGEDEKMDAEYPDNYMPTHNWNQE